MRISLRLLRQTQHPPRRVYPLEHNPLTRWSHKLPRWSTVGTLLSQCAVGLEGCGSAFNATNSIRTCMFFGTGVPPCFMSVASWDAIENVQLRPPHQRRQEKEKEEDSRGAASSSDGGKQRSGMDDCALFGQDAFVHGPMALTSPIVALENFTSRAESIFHCRFPANSRLVVGHENLGVSRQFLDGTSSIDSCMDSGTANTTSSNHGSGADSLCAEAVLYIPQYGTISSLNVVTSLGIALFYAYMDHHYPNSRQIVPSRLSKGLAEASQRRTSHTEDSLYSTEADDEATQHARKLLEDYQRQFEKAIPAPLEGEGIVLDKVKGDPHANPTPRVDPRPVHPLYYKKDYNAILAAHDAFRRALLDYSAGSATTTTTAAAANTPAAAHPSRFGLSVLYENEFDQRNFGGLVRNANAFLVDRVCYVGRRKLNVVGAVGSYHYTPPEYLGEMEIYDSLDTDAANGELSGMESATLEVNTADSSSVSVQAWSQQLRSKAEAACGGPLRFWFLDCGHGSLYSSTRALEEACRTETSHAANCSSHSPTVSASLLVAKRLSASSPSSLRWYKVRSADPTFCLSLCDAECVLREATDGDAIMLVVPQEGKLPHYGLLHLCERIISVLPSDMMQQQHARGVRGLPSQVASGIALQRLSAVLHPRIKYF